MARTVLTDTLRARASGAGTSPTVRATLATIGVGLVVTIGVFGSTVLLLLTVPALQQWTALFIVAAITVHGSLMLTVIWRFLRRSGIALSAIGLDRPTWRLLHLLWQIPVVFIAVLLAQGLVFAVTGNDPGGDSQAVDALMASASPPVAVLLFLAVVVLTPLWEELLFRGMIQGSVRARFGRLAGMAISALVFAAAHGVPILLPYMLTLGCALALLREFHGSLWAPLAMHCTLNAVASSAILTALR